TGIMDIAQRATRSFTRITVGDKPWTGQFSASRSSERLALSSEEQVSWQSTFDRHPSESTQGEHERNPCNLYPMWKSLFVGTPKSPHAFLRLAASALDAEDQTCAPRRNRSGGALPPARD